MSSRNLNQPLRVPQLVHKSNPHDVLRDRKADAAEPFQVLASDGLCALVDELNGLTPHDRQAAAIRCAAQLLQIAMYADARRGALGNLERYLAALTEIDGLAGDTGAQARRPADRNPRSWPDLRLI